MPALAPHQRIFVGLDTPDVEKATDLARRLAGHVGGIKLGKEFFVANGPQGVRAVSAVGMPVFLDLKFHDIPNTVAGAVRSALPLAPAILNVHAAGGSAMMMAAREVLETNTHPRPMLVAVTVLTSLGDDDLREIGIEVTAEDLAVHLATLAKACGLDGVVCSPHEIAPIRAVCGPDFKLVVPGIRPKWAAKGDQKRITTPKEAIDAGADFIVIGRPIAAAEDPEAAAIRIADELGA